jgi:hypothetical protein
MAASAPRQSLAAAWAHRPTPLARWTAGIPIYNQGVSGLERHHIEARRWEHGEPIRAKDDVGWRQVDNKKLPTLQGLVRSTYRQLYLGDALDDCTGRDNGTRGRGLVKSGFGSIVLVRFRCSRR